HEHRRVCRDPLHAVSETIVAAVVPEEGIVRVLQEAEARLLRRQRARLLAVAGAASPPVSAECLALEQVLATRHLAVAARTAVAVRTPVIIRAMGRRPYRRQAKQHRATEHRSSHLHLLVEVTSIRANWGKTG